MSHNQTLVLKFALPRTIHKEGRSIISAAICGWDAPFLTFTYPTFDCDSHFACLVCGWEICVLSSTRVFVVARLFLQPNPRTDRSPDGSVLRQDGLRHEDPLAPEHQLQEAFSGAKRRFPHARKSVNMQPEGGGGGECKKAEMKHTHGVWRGRWNSRGSPERLWRSVGRLCLFIESLDV